jgi:hypothetical protein
MLAPVDGWRSKNMAAGLEMKVIADELKLRMVPRTLYEECPKNHHAEIARRIWLLIEESPRSLALEEYGWLTRDEGNCRRTEAQNGAENAARRMPEEPR